MSIKSTGNATASRWIKSFHLIVVFASLLLVFLFHFSSVLFRFLQIEIMNVGSIISGKQSRRRPKRANRFSTTSAWFPLVSSDACVARRFLRKQSQTGADHDRIWTEIFGWGHTAISLKFSLAVLVPRSLDLPGGLASAISDGGQR